MAQRTKTCIGENAKIVAQDGTVTLIDRDDGKSTVVHSNGCGWAWRSWFGPLDYVAEWTTPDRARRIYLNHTGEDIA